jgi:hypothetical protein
VDVWVVALLPTSPNVAEGDSTPVYEAAFSFRTYYVSLHHPEAASHQITTLREFALARAHPSGLVIPRPSRHVHVALVTVVIARNSGRRPRQRAQCLSSLEDPSSNFSWTLPRRTRIRQPRIVLFNRPACRCPYSVPGPIGPARTVPFHARECASWCARQAGVV